MATGTKGLNLIKKFEGCRLKAYKCPAGVWTIGYGHTNGVKEGQVITQAQADNFLKQDLKIYENYVYKIVKLRLNQNQFDALVSFTYNCGPGCLKTLIQNRNYEQIADAILLYNKAGGKVLEGLTNRRRAEKDLFERVPTAATQQQKLIVTATALNVRAGAGTQYKIVRTLHKRNIVRVIETSNGWGRIEDGWIFLRYTKKA